jgi:hypothetical protein
VSGRVIQIIGTALNAGLTPDVQGAERWCSNNPRVYRIRCPKARQTWTRWFNMHSMRHIQKKYPGGYLWYQQQDGTRPIYLRDEVDPTIAGSRVFPGPMLMDYFANHGERETFFSFSCAWFLAFAIYEHLELDPVKRIEFWGIEMKRGHQWGFERPAMHYWIGRAEQAGIEVLIPEGVNIRKDRVGRSVAAGLLREALEKRSDVVLSPGQVTRDDPDDYETVHYLIGRCRQAGIRVVLPPDSGLCHAPKLYGYETT